MSGSAGPSTSSGQAHHRRFGAQVVAALADVFGLDDAAPKCAGRVQFSHARGGLGWNECQARTKQTRTRVSQLHG
jgi:hypothetical protein